MHGKLTGCLDFAAVHCHHYSGAPVEESLPNGVVDMSYQFSYETADLVISGVD